MKNKRNYAKHGYYRFAAFSPKLALGNPLVNAKEIVELTKKAEKKNTAVCLFPELSLTGYTCDDLFLGEDLLNKVHKSVQYLTQESKSISSVIVVGCPIMGVSGNLFNCALVIYAGRIIGAIPKTYIPNYGEFYEKRWFASGRNIDETVTLSGQEVRIKKDRIFQFGQMKFAIEICEDLWAPIPPSSFHALSGAHVILNLSASNELVAKSDYRKELIAQQSARLNCSYLYSSAGPLESTKDLVFGGHLIAAENGNIIEESDRFYFNSTCLFVDFDIKRLEFERRRNGTFFENTSSLNEKSVVTVLTDEYFLGKIKRQYSKTPFIPNKAEELKKRVNEILEIQSTGLARRLHSIGTSRIVLGLSGGLDSTLALIVAERAIKKTNGRMEDIHCITMPGFGTSPETKNLAVSLAESFGVTFKTADITKAVIQHFEDIGHDINDLSIVYENSQARERTQILFDYANKVGGIVLGTGDLSELALGWCTFNGDQMSSYNVNSSIPKTLVKFIINEYATTQEDSRKELLGKILGLVISPELLPVSADGKIQSTEDKIGPYFLHDFFLYHFIRSGFSQKKIHILAEKVFKDEYTIDDIEKWHKVFFSRFFASQFKRTTLPPGPKVGSVSLSPRGDWRCPDEIK